MFSRLLLATALVIGLSASLQAQYLRHPLSLAGNQQSPTQPTEIEGTIEGVTRGGIMVVDANNQSWRVAVPPTAKVQVTGSATADYLQTGLIVELKADIDDHGAIKEKVGELTIVSLSPEKQMGLFPPDSDGKAGDEKAALARGRGGRAGRQAGQTGQTRRQRRGSAIPAGSYRIVGRLIGRPRRQVVGADRPQARCRWN